MKRKRVQITVDVDTPHEDEQLRVTLEDLLNGAMLRFYLQGQGIVPAALDVKVIPPGPR